MIVLMRAGQVSFGNAMFACLAGYAVAFAGALLASRRAAADRRSAPLLAALAGAVIGLFMVRYRGIFFGMLNLAFSMMLFAVLGKFGAVTGGTDGLRFDRPTLRRRRSWSATASRPRCSAVGAARWRSAAGWCVQRYFGSVSGQALAAIKTNETRLEYLGHLGQARVLGRLRAGARHSAASAAPCSR